MKIIDQFEGKVVVVAGGGSGIGRAVAIAAADAGAKVVVGDIHSKNADTTVKEIRSSGGEARSVYGDGSTSEFAITLVEESLRSFGKIHYLCNSVGIQTYGTVEDTLESDWDKMLECQS